MEETDTQQQLGMKNKKSTHHSKSASVQSQGPDVIDTKYVFPITHLDVGFSFW